jgi:hypothetical protein
VINGLQISVEFRRGETEKTLATAKQLLDRAAKMQVVDYSIYVGFFHIMDVVFLALKQAHRENSPANQKKELLEYARLSTKIMKSYSQVFAVGEPAFYRYNGWVQWYLGKKEKAYQSWRTAGEKANQIPMYYEEGQAYLALGENLPPDDPEQARSFEKARAAFTRGGFENWVETVQKTMG